MSTEAAPAAGRRHTCEDGSQGRPQSGEEGPSCGETSGGGDGGGEDGAAGGRVCKPQAAPSNSSSETCIPTPSCRICFQGAEQVGPARFRPGDKVRTTTTEWCCRRAGKTQGRARAHT